MMTRQHELENRALFTLQFGKVNLATSKVNSAKQPNSNMDFNNLAKWNWEACKVKLTN